MSDLGRTTVYEGDRLYLSCLVRGVPKPDIKWLLDGHEVRTPPVTEMVWSRKVVFFFNHSTKIAHLSTMLTCRIHCFTQ